MSGPALAIAIAIAVAVVVAAALAAFAVENARRRRHPVPHGHRPETLLPHRQDFELHHNALSLCSMKTRLCLAELGVAYASHHVELIETGAYENLRASFLAVNPAGTVPVLVHQGHPIYESHEQIRYAADHAAPDRPPLVPADPSLRAEMERWIDRSSITGDPMNQGDASAGNAVPGLTVPLFAAMIDRIATWRILEGLLFHFDKRRPLVFLVLKLAGLGRFGRIAPAVRVLARSRRQMAAHLDALEEQLAKSGGPFILGAAYSLADVSWLVIFERLVQADVLHVFLGTAGEKRPRCAAWWQALSARPAYRQAIEDHAHPTVTRGTRRLREAKAADPALRAVLEGA